MRLKAFISLISSLMVVVAMMSVVASAEAAEGEPFGIAKFSMQTTERTKEVPVGIGGKQGVEFVNGSYGPVFR